MKRIRDVDDYIAAHDAWSGVLRKLRRILTATELEETIKWGMPCYTLGGRNVVGLGAFESHCGLWFFQGVFLSDPDGVLVNAQQGRTRAQRHWRFTSERGIRVARVRAYVAEAIENQRQGRELQPRRRQGVTVPDELQRALAARPAAQRAFAALTPGRQREYAEHVASAKRASTREGRVAKILPLIEAGVGLNDRYRRR